MNTTELVAWGGLAIILLLVFTETGLLVGLVVPGGETLVFTAGLLVSTGTLSISITILLVLLILASILGDSSGYYIGKRFGKNLYHKKDTWYFKKQYLHMVKDYLHKHSRMALIIGKFFPFIRPFAPLVSGVSNVKFGKFIPLTAVASILYMSIFSLAGYFLGMQFPVIKEYIGYILPISIIISVALVLMQIRKYKRDHSA